MQIGQRKRNKYPGAGRIVLQADIDDTKKRHKEAEVKTMKGAGVRVKGFYTSVLDKIKQPYILYLTICNNNRDRRR